MKLDNAGNVVWQNTAGGTGDDVGSSIVQTSDGGYVIGGSSNSPWSLGSYDGFVLKLDASGHVAWTQTYGGSAYDEINAIRQTSDGGYIAVGDANSDLWVLRLDSSGNILWQKAMGGTGNDSAYDVRATSDGGFIVAGVTSSFGAGGSERGSLN